MGLLIITHEIYVLHRVSNIKDDEDISLDSGVVFPVMGQINIFIFDRLINK